MRAADVAALFVRPPQVGSCHAIAPTDPESTRDAHTARAVDDSAGGSAVQPDVGDPPGAGRPDDDPRPVAGDRLPEAVAATLARAARSEAAATSAYRAAADAEAHAAVVAVAAGQATVREFVVVDRAQGAQDVAPSRRPTLRVVPDADDERPANPGPAPSAPDEPKPRFEVEPARTSGPAPTAARPAAPAPGAGRSPRVCVVGGGRAGMALARVLAARLARRPGARSAVLWVPAGDREGAPAPRSSVIRGAAARRLAVALQAEDRLTGVRGRVVEVAVDGCLAGDLTVPEPVPVVTVLPGVRSSADDAALEQQDVVLVVVDPDAPPALAAVAVGDLGRLAPAAAVEVVVLPGRGGTAARRAAVTRALELLP